MSALLIVPIAGIAQTTAAERANVGWALTRVGQAGSALTIICDGEQKLGTNASDQFRIELMVDFANEASPKIAVHEFLNGKLVSKTVGDGTRLWTYGVQSNAYTTSIYGQSVPAGQTKKTFLLKQLSSGSKGQLTHFAQLLKDIFTNGKPDDWMPFMPAARFEYGQFVNPSKSKSESMYYMYDPTAITPTITEVGYYMSESRLGQQRTIEWKATFFSGGLPNLQVFEFVPPPGSTALRAKK